MRDIQSRSGAVVTAGCDTSPTARQAAVEEFPGLKVSSTLEEMFESADGDALVIATPPRYHRVSAEAGFKRELHVFCEKPFGVNAKETESIVRRGAAAGRHLGAGLNVRALPAVRALLGAIGEGRLGDLVSVHSSWTRCRKLPGSTSYPPAWYRSKVETGGGVLRDLGAHILDVSLLAAGYPTGRVSGFGALSNRLSQAASASTEPPFDVEDSARVLLQFEDGLSLSCCSSWVEQADGREDFLIHVVGTTGVARVFGHEGKSNLALELLGCAEPSHSYSSTVTPLTAFIDTIAISQPSPSQHRGDLVTLARLLDALACSGATGSSFQIHL
jgi:predicted dehydrogenase